MPQATPKFSIIVPVYNVQSYLSQCVGSVLSQEGSFECILVNDGSTDKSGAMCEAFAQLDARVKVVHQKNQGLAAARATGMRQATGEWLLFLDSDDYWPEHMLGPLEAEMAAHPGFDAFVCEYQELDENTGVIAPPGAVKLVPGEFESDEYPARVARFYESAHWSVWKLALRRSFLEEHHLTFEPSVIYAEDMPFDLSLLRFCKKLCFLPLCMVIYRANRAGSLMNVNLPKHFRGILASYNYFLPQFAEMPAVEQKEILARLANSFWPDVRAAAALPKAERRAAAPLIKQLNPLWRLGNQCRGRADWALFRILLCVFGPRFTLFVGHCFYALKK